MHKPPPPRVGGTAPRPAAGKPAVRAPAPTLPDIAPARCEPGDVIAGKYRLVSLLGEGGMGAVWRARNMDLDVEVALKLIRAESTVTEATDRLLREAQAAAKLIDPGIVRVFDFGRSEHGNPFIVMELLEGEDLAAAIQRRGRLSPKRAVRVLLPVMRALTIAHENGIVHRDLKPENVFLGKTPNGLQPKVVDFGIAQLDKSQALRLTSTGALMGSPLYMSPEQAKGEPVDFRADIWGITAVLYEAITAKQPFPGTNY
ncbi:MAG TPA: serine/threonine-protein kinase, partial [Polyangiaceae bacterium]|nr:serine/threonine-protein kinase [Polyangiaceae bacterium]